MTMSAQCSTAAADSETAAARVALVHGVARMGAQASLTDAPPTMSSATLFFGHNLSQRECVGK